MDQEILPYSQSILDAMSPPAHLSLQVFREKIAALRARLEQLHTSLSHPVPHDPNEVRQARLHLLENRRREVLLDLARLRPEAEKKRNLHVQLSRTIAEMKKEDLEIKRELERISVRMETTQVNEPTNPSIGGHLRSLLQQGHTVESLITRLLGADVLEAMQATPPVSVRHEAGEANTIEHIAAHELAMNWIAVARNKENAAMLKRIVWKMEEDTAKMEELLLPFSSS